MSKEILFSIVFVVGVLVASISQIMLKKSASTNGASDLRAYLNPLVIGAYILFVLSTLTSLLCLKHIPLSRAPILDAAGYIFVAILSRIIFKEKLYKKKILGFSLIVLGIIIGVL